jgi:hypothetical protein
MRLFQPYDDTICLLSGSRVPRHQRPGELCAAPETPATKRHVFKHIFKYVTRLSHQLELITIARRNARASKAI